MSLRHPQTRHEKMATYGCMAAVGSLVLTMYTGWALFFLVYTAAIIVGWYGFFRYLQARAVERTGEPPKVKAPKKVWTEDDL